MYVTTSRKPSPATRVLSRNISAFLSGMYENRGKKSIDDVASHARLLGHNRVIIISESGGNPNNLAFIEVTDSWEWLKPEIMFSVPTESLKERIRSLGKHICVKTKDKDFAKLFGIKEPTTDDTVTLSISSDTISFSYDNKRLALKI